VNTLSAPAMVLYPNVARSLDARLSGILGNFL
jgi:hypothetical protein